MKTRVRELPAGSHEVTVWYEGEPDLTDFDLAYNIHPISADICWIGRAIGRMPLRAQIGAAVQAADLGYKVLTFKRLKSRTKPRYAQFTGSDANFNYFEVDLTKGLAAATLEKYRDG